MRSECIFFFVLFHTCTSHEGTVETHPGTNTNEDVLRELKDIADTLERTTGDDVLGNTNNDDTEISRMKTMLADLGTIKDAQQDQQQVQYQPVGCYKDNQVDPRPLPELLADLTSLIDWSDFDKVIRKCAALASKKGYTYFGLQSFGQCRSGKDAEKTFNSDGNSSGCMSGGLGTKGENFVYKIVSDAIDGCYNHTVLSCKNRAMTYSNQSVLKCDRDLSPGWYRYMGNAGTQMPTSCVPTHHCGTRAPGWLNGQHPNVSEGEVVRRVCFHWSGGCCAWHVDVKVKNCDGFYVYKFGQLPDVCEYRFCGNGREFNATTKTPTRPSAKPTTFAQTTQETTTTKQPTTLAATTKETTTTVSTTPAPTTQPPTTPPPPQECERYTNLTSANRSVNFNQSVGSCDDDLQRGWYRFAGSAGNMMPTSCVTKRHCGAHAPGWLQGPHPAVHDGRVSRDVCFSWKSCCSWRISILIRNCGSYFVYYLAPPLTCNLRYCGNGQALTTTRAPTTSKPTTTESTTVASSTKSTRPPTTTQEPTTRAPSTQPPTTRTKSTTLAPSTRPPTTSAESTTRAPSTQPPTTRTVSTTPASTTQPPTTQPPTTSPRPQECKSYTNLTSANRSVNFNQSVGSCDNHLQRGWYRFAGSAGNMMPTSCVTKRHCGAHAPGWLQGPHPAVHDGRVSRDVCFSWKSCCSWRISILIRNCGSYFVYYLAPPPTCNLRYCGNGQALTTTRAPTTSKPTTTESTTVAPSTKSTRPPTTTQESTTLAPSTRPPTTQQESTTRVPSTQPPTTRTVSATPASTTQPPTTQPPTTSPPPQECESYTNLTSANRSVNFNQSAGSCDNHLQRGWYRFAGSAGNMMPTSCVTKRHCGAHAPGWLQGPHPAVHDGRVSRDVCFSYRSCCSWRISILIRNCGSYFVYYLAPPLTCNLRYCGTGQESTTAAPSTQPPTTPAVSSTTPSSTPRPTPTSLPSPSPPTPSECSNYKFLEEANRAQAYQTNNRPAKCDNTLPRDWYRFRGAAGDQMPTSCVKKLRCGTHAPGWLTARHPSADEGAVNATVCFHWSNSCCYWSAKIRVRNCGGFYVYEFNRVAHCSSRYCGNGGQVSTSPTPTPLTTTATSRPTPGEECLRYRVLKTVDRSQKYDHRKVQGARPICDKSLPTAWYRFQGLAGNRMPDTCVPTHRCGTRAPGWLQGRHPSILEGVVSRKVCFNWRNNCCRWSTSISVRNCGRFYVYKLHKPPVCRLRYCGEGQIVPTQLPTTQLTSPTKPSHGFVIICLPAGMHVQLSRQSLPSLFDPSLLHLDDPSCGVVRMDENNVVLTTPLDSCGTTRRTIGGQMSFHNKVIAEPGFGQKRGSVFEFPFKCSYRRFPSAPGIRNKLNFKPLSKRGQIMDDSTSDYEARDD